MPLVGSATAGGKRQRTSHIQLPTALLPRPKSGLWIGVHFGSRGFGYGNAGWFLEAANAKDGMDVDPCTLDIGSDLGGRR